MIPLIEHHTDSKGVLTVALNRPGRRNAFEETMIRAMIDLFGTASTEPSVRLVRLQGNGSVFCAGGDIVWMSECARATLAIRREKAGLIYDLFDTLDRCQKPIVCAVQGAALGGAVGLVAGCDVVVATHDAMIGVSEAARGIVPACLMPLLLRKIGASHTRRLFLSARRIAAEEAQAIGLVHYVTDCTASLTTCTEAMVSELLGVSVHAQSAAKSLCRRLTLDTGHGAARNRSEVVHALADSWASADAQEGMRAFLEKRSPVWLPP